MALAVLFLAGLSLFFTGVSGVKAKLQQLSGRKFRQMLARVTDRPILAGAVGAGFGALTQSASAVAFILSGMVATGLLTLRRALPVVAASNVGTALLVFLAAIDLRLAILALIGITGLMINFKIASRFEALLGALFAIGLLFLGLGMMKEAFAPLPGYPWFQALAAFLKSWPLATFLLGAGLRMVIQSSSAIGVIAIALQVGGIFTEFQSVMLVCGTGPGVALSGLFLGGNLSGPPKQIVLYQGLINLLSGCAMGTLFYLSEFSGHTLLFQFLDIAALDASGRIAWAFFLNMTGCLLIGLIITPFVEPLLQRLAPPSLEQDLARPAFLHEGALEIPTTALELVDKEQFRFYSLALRSLDTVREEAQSQDQEGAIHSATLGLRKEISTFLQELIQRGATVGTASSILQLERRQENLGALLDTIHQFIGVQNEVEATSKVKVLMTQLTESLHLLLLTTQDAWTSRDEFDLKYLEKMTEDRGDTMERMRILYQDADVNRVSEQDKAVFYATTLFERIVWLLRQLGLSLGMEN